MFWPGPCAPGERAKMGSMNDSMAHAQPGPFPLALPGWKTALSWISAAILAILFAVAGVWKITDAPGWAVRINELRIPQSLSLPAALGFGIAETLAAVFVLVPKFRRWGAILTGLLLVGFMGYFAVNYSALHGAECSCFPFVKRVVGPMFFVGDGALLLLAVFAGVWSKPSSGTRTALMVLGAVAVFAGVSYGVEAARQTGTKAPDTVTVAGQPYSLQHGKIFLFFFDPECLHCLDAAKRMSHYGWDDTRVVAIPIQQPQFAAGFLEDTKLKAVVSNDHDVLKKLFPYVSAPAGVALVNGREVKPVTDFDGAEPGATLKQLGFVK
jgi:methylamine utilization protein MauE